MTAPRPIDAGRPLRGSLRLPGSKSATQRYLNLALVAGRSGVEWVLREPLASDDTKYFSAGLEAIGCRVEWLEQDGATTLTVAPPPEGEVGADERTIYCGHGGTMMRFLVAALTTKPGRWLVDGSPRLRERPLGPMLDTLRQLGAEIECLEVEGFPPVRITGGSLRGGSATLDAGASSQYLSAVLMAGLGASNPVELEVEALVSAPYVELTVEAIERFGGRVQRDGDRWRVEPTELGGGVVEVEGDWSSASYWLVGAPLTGGEIRLQGLRADSRQGDRGFVDVAAQLGGHVAWEGDELVARAAGPLRAVDVDFSEMPDLVPTLAAVAPFAEGITRITNVAHLRIKESDRLAAMTRELTRTGAEVEEREDGLVLRGCWAHSPTPSDPVTIETYDDHRIAMSMALVGSRRSGVSIADSGVVAKSYPAFWRHLETLKS